MDEEEAGGTGREREEVSQSVSQFVGQSDMSNCCVSCRQDKSTNSSGSAMMMMMMNAWVSEWEHSGGCRGSPAAHPLLSSSSFLPRDAT